MTVVVMHNLRYHLYVMTLMLETTVHYVSLSLIPHYQEQMLVVSKVYHGGIQNSNRTLLMPQMVS